MSPVLCFLLRSRNADRFLAGTLPQPTGPLVRQGRGTRATPPAQGPGPAPPAGRAVLLVLTIGLWSHGHPGETLQRGFNPPQGQDREGGPFPDPASVSPSNASGRARPPGALAGE